MKINPSIFRSYDVRGIYPYELNEEVFSKIIKAYIKLYPKAKKIVVAQDTRLSSPSLAKEVISTLFKAGKEVIDIGIAPDPLFYFSIFHYNFDGGVMITASHNPKEYNGMGLNVRKLNGEIEDIIGKDLEKIKKMVISNKKIDLPDKKGKITVFDPSRDYIDYVIPKINLKRPLKVILDSGNGACGFLPGEIFKKIGCEVETLYGEFDGSFPNHLPDPYEEKNLEKIKKEVISKKADIGFAYDTDGDRVGVIDNQGRPVQGDFCLLMLANQALKKKKGPICHDMRVSKAFLDEMKKIGVPTHFCISHHSSIIKKILETKAVFGGEITLHFLFPLDYYLCDEAIFSSLKIAEIASNQDDFAKHIDGLPRYFASPEIFIDVKDEEKFKIVENLQKYLRKNKYDFIDVDGARINFSNGWALIRAANTSPFIKCRFEGETENGLIEIEKKSLEIFKKTGIPITEAVYKKLNLK